MHILLLVENSKRKFLETTRLFTRDNINFSYNWTNWCFSVFFFLISYLCHFTRNGISLPSVMKTRITFLKKMIHKKSCISEMTPRVQLTSLITYIYIFTMQDVFAKLYDLSGERLTSFRKIIKTPPLWHRIKMDFTKLT